MASTSTNHCIYCLKECKVTDSKPYPSTKSKDRIHIKCYVKKSIEIKQLKKTGGAQVASSSAKTWPADGKRNFSFATTFEFVDDETEKTRLAQSNKISRVLSEEKRCATKGSNLFFDLKAGIAKPHEKKCYLHHRNIKEIAARYNDQGFQEESIGRAYDHGGKDLTTLGDDDEPEAKPSRSTEEIYKRKLDEGSNKRCDNQKHDRKRSRALTVGDDNPCWFCLSSPNVEKHLIVDIAEHCYLTLAKGGLVDEHLLIIPIEHIQSSNSEDNSTQLLDELQDIKESIITFFGKQSKGVIFFERNFRSVHWQLQAVPVPIDMMDDLPTKIKSISKLHYNGPDYIDIPSSCGVGDIIPQNAPYFYWEIAPTGSKFVCRLQTRDNDSFFPIQLGRLVLADEAILNCPDKIDWKRCVKSSDDYAESANVFRDKFKALD